MSQMEFHIGEATLIASNREDSIKIAKGILEDLGKEVGPYYKDEIECLLSTVYEKYFYHNKTGSLYQLENENFEDDDDIIEAENISPTKFKYRLKFYNGGTCFEECLEEAFNKIQK